MRNLAALLLLLAFPVITGCPGELLICGVNWDLCEQLADDDDDDDVELDFANYDGREYLNIDWTQEQEEAGAQDCIGIASWRAQGPSTLADDANLCPNCDEIWTVQLVPNEAAEGCLEGTDIPLQASYTRKVGIEFGSGNAFQVYRSSFSAGSPLGQSANDPMVVAGIGAFLGTEFTWSGGDEPVDVPSRGFSFWFSGQGSF